jgi:phosphoglycerate dehydrogenase-like enzyme
MEKDMKLLRWGQSAYETQEDLFHERQELQKLGCTITQQKFPPQKTTLEGLIVTSKVDVSADLMRTLPALELILTTTSGYEHIDVSYALNNGITVGRCPIARRDAVIDSSIAMASSLIRSFPALHNKAQQGLWTRNSLPKRNMKRIKDLSIGIVGYGIIGRAAFRVWSDLGAKVRWYDPNVLGSFPLEELLHVSDVVSLHCAHTSSAHHIINNETLSMMQQGSILINTARGPCLDTEALKEATHLGGYGLDVFPQEPPADLSELAQHPNSIILPHAAGYHNELGTEVAKEVVESIRLWIEEKRLPHIVLEEV